MSNLKPGCKSPLRICVGMINSPSIPKYAQYTTMLNYMYATKHSYDFVVNRCPDDTDIDWKWDAKNEYVSVWYKPEFIKKYLKYYHFFVFIDSDAYFKDMDKTVESFLQNEDNNNPETLIYVAKDCKDKEICWTSGPNTGVIIVRNTPKTFELLDEWINAPKTDLCKFWKYRHTREQGCLWELRNSKFSKEIRIVEPAYKLGTHDGDWVVHLAATSGDYREKYFGDLFRNFSSENFSDETSINISYMTTTLYNTLITLLFIAIICIALITIIYKQ